MDNDPARSADDATFTNYAELLRDAPGAVEAPASDSATKVLVAGSPEYLAAEQRKAELQGPVTGLIALKYGAGDSPAVTILATEHREGLDDPELAYLRRYVEELEPASGAVLILEGQYDTNEYVPQDIAEAAAMGEFTLMAAAARERGVEVIPAEADPHAIVASILVERPDITRAELAVHYTIKALNDVMGGYGQSQDLSAVAPYIHHCIGIAGDAAEGGWVEHSTSRDEVRALDESGQAEIDVEAEQLIPKLNEAFAQIVPGQSLLVRQPDGRYRLDYDLTRQPVLWDPTPEANGGNETILTDISRLDMLMRDRHTLALTKAAVAAGKSPTVAFGNSHLSTLRPALEAEFPAL